MTKDRLDIILSVIDREPVTHQMLQRICSKKEIRFILKRKLIKRDRSLWVVANSRRRRPSKHKKHNTAIQKLYCRYGQGATAVSMNSVFFTESGKVCPDLVIKIGPKKEHLIAIEAERNQKAKDKFAAKLCMYDLIPEIQEVIYAFETIEHLRAYENISRELGLCSMRFRFVLI